MKAYTGYIVNKIILPELRNSDSQKYIFCLHSIEDAEIYYTLCTFLQEYCDEKNLIFVAKLATRKYEDFKNNSDYTHFAQKMMYADWVDNGDQMTCYRNFMPPDGKKYVILLMGTEMVDDKGGLADFFTINPQLIDAHIGTKFSDLFGRYGNSNFGWDDFKSAFDTFYKILFSSIEKNIVRLCDQIDMWTEQQLTEDEIWQKMFLTLPEEWSVPGISDYPSITSVKQKKKIDILKDACDFIRGTKYSKVTKAVLKKIETQFALYQQEGKYAFNFPSSPKIRNLDDLKFATKNYISRNMVEQNRQILLEVDYSVLYDVMGVKLPTRKAVRSNTKLYGDPLNAFLEAFLTLATDEEIIGYTINTARVVVNKIEIGAKGILADEVREKCIDEWKRVGRFAGGVIPFIDAESWFCRDDSISFKCCPVDIFEPHQAAKYFDDGMITKVDRENHVVTFTLSVDVVDADDSIKEFEHIFEWNIKPNSDWLIAFDTLATLVDSRVPDDHVPFIVWKNINEAFRAKSETEFAQIIDHAHLDVNQINLYDQVTRISARDYIDERSAYADMNDRFRKFKLELTEKGFFSTISESAPKFIASYVSAVNAVHDTNETQDIMQYLMCLLNAFIIADSQKIITSGKAIEQCIVMPYHPTMLEKMVDRMVFIRTGLSQWYERKLENTTKESLSQAIERLTNLSYVHNAVDAFQGEDKKLIPVSRVYGYFALYGEYKAKNDFVRMSTMLQKEEVFDDDFRESTFKRMNAEAKMIVNTIEDYLETYAQVNEGLTLTFVNPKDLQTIVAAISGYVVQQKKRLQTDDLQKMQVDVNILQPKAFKGGRNYLAFWLDTMLDMDDNINMEVYCDTWEKPEEISRKIPKNTDIVFFMDVLHESNGTHLHFRTLENQGVMQPSECKYPMVFRSAIDPSLQISRRVDLTQFQFDASAAHTQLLSRYNDIKNDQKRVIYQEAKLSETMARVISNAHNNATWVVCVDDALDRKTIREIKGKKTRPIIGFTTGEGSFGQLNLTITTRECVADDIRKRCRRRLKMIFSEWSDEALNTASQTCIERAGRLDGISVLQALNPSAYEINNYLAYLMLDELKTYHQRNQVLIRLDSYRHWFDTNIELVTGSENSKNIPDFLLLSFDIDSKGKLVIDADVIECKIAKISNASGHLEKAVKQVDAGYRILSAHFSPTRRQIERRYWLAQLYRAVAFVQEDVEISDSVRLNLEQILDGTFSISWRGEVYGFWFDQLTDDIDVINGYSENIDITINNVGQGVILRILLGKEREAPVQYMANVGPIEDSDEEDYLDLDEEESQSEEEELFDETDITTAGVSTPKAVKYEGENSLANHSSEESSEKTENKDHTIEPAVEKVNYSKINLVGQITEQKGDNAFEEDNESEQNTQNSGESETSNLEGIRVLIGKDRRNQNVYWEFGNKGLGNRHMLITGSSGQGKTYMIQAMLLELAKQNISSIIFDYTDGFLPNKLEPEFVEEIGDRMTQRVAIMHKIPINPFKKRMIEIPPFGSMLEDSGSVAGRLADILAHVYSFGEQQQAAVYAACRDGIDKFGDSMNFKKLRKMLESSSSMQAKSVLNKMAQFFDKNLFEAEDNFDWKSITEADGQVTVIQLTALDRQMQTVITEIMLWDAWYSITKFGDKNRPFAVVLDEAQNLSFKEASPAEKILREGRKYGWSAWFATQFLKGALDSGEISNLQQAAERLYFKPSGEEMAYVAKQIANDKSEDEMWYNTVKNLQKGHCIVQGDRVKPNGQFGAAKAVLVSVTSLGER